MGFNPENYEWLKNYDGSYNWYDSIPKGWRNTFGEMLIQEIDDVVKQDNVEVGGDFGFRVLEIKEKFGELRMYCGGTTNEIEDIINKYSVLSRNICIYCGKPDVPSTNSYWIIPICENCYREKFNKDYELATSGDCKMPDSYIVCKNGKSKSIDISETANRIRKNWRSTSL